MPHVPDLSAHDVHDPELIAAHAAGDLEGSRLAAAEALLASCTTCAELHADLRAITAALPSVPARPRTRDFRLTPAQAAALRPTGWRGVLAAFAAPRLSFTAPLGAGLAALGVAALLLAAMPGAVPLLPPGDAAAMRQEDVNAGGAGIEVQPTGQGPAVPWRPFASPPGDDDLAGWQGGDDDTTKAASLAAEAEAARARQADEILVLVGGIALVVGVGLAGLRWSARRPV